MPKPPAGAHRTMSQSGPFSHSHVPSKWVERFADQIPIPSRVLDVACGAGRHTRLFLAKGHTVTAIDRDLTQIADLNNKQLSRIEADLESGAPWPLSKDNFACVIVTNYLYRPILKNLVSNVESGGMLIYETFAEGNEKYGRPTNPDFLLKPGEVLRLVHNALRVIAYEDVTLTHPKAAQIQRIAAFREPVR